MSRILLEQHKPWPGKVYIYFVVDDEGHIIEGNLPSEEHAWTVIDFLKDTQGYKNLHIEVQHCPKKKGLGRDPDLH